MPSDALTQTLLFRGVNSVALLDVRLCARTSKQEHKIQLGLAEVVVGSDPSCDLVLEDEMVSRRHCALLLDEAGVRVRDLGSKNGTRVGGARVLEAYLEPGQQLQVGGSRLWLELGDQPTELTLATTNRFGDVYGQSVAMRAVFSTLQKAAQSDAGVLLVGETGTGKDALTRALHQASARRDQPMVVCDCSALTPTLVEAELFGHQKGAFSGATTSREGLFRAAHGGTLFLDEVGELPLDLQPKLLRALESRKVRPVGSTSEVVFDVRVVAATHRDLRAAVRAGTFREDLYFRLAILEVRVPPLRERRDDVPLLVEQLLAARTPPLSLADLPPNTLKLLSTYSWPGNVRELRNVVERLVLTQSLDGLKVASAEPLRPWTEARADAIARFEAEYLNKALLLSSGNLAQAARLLGVTRQLIHQLATRHGLTD